MMLIDLSLKIAAILSTLNSRFGTARFAAPVAKFWALPYSEGAAVDILLDTSPFISGFNLFG